MENKKALNNFFIPFLKLKGVIDSNNKINASKAKAAGWNVKLNSKPKKSKTETSIVTKNNNKRKGISESILNQSNLLKKKSKTKKKTLLGD